MLSPFRKVPQSLFSLKFISPLKRWNFENRTKSAESGASEIDGPFGEYWERPPKKEARGEIAAAIGPNCPQLGEYAALVKVAARGRFELAIRICFRMRRTARKSGGPASEGLPRTDKLLLESLSVKFSAIAEEPA